MFTKTPELEIPTTYNPYTLEYFWKKKRTRLKFWYHKCSLYVQTSLKKSPRRVLNWWVAPPRRETQPKPLELSGGQRFNQLNSTVNSVYEQLPSSLFSMYLMQMVKGVHLRASCCLVKTHNAGITEPVELTSQHIIKLKNWMNISRGLNVWFFLCPWRKSVIFESQSL